MYPTACLLPLGVTVVQTFIMLTWGAYVIFTQHNILVLLRIIYLYSFLSLLQLINLNSYDVLVYLRVLLVNIALNQTWIALLIALICVFPESAFRFSQVISAVAGFSSGFFIPTGLLPPW